jgi:hypothetical protein
MIAPLNLISTRICGTTGVAQTVTKPAVGSIVANLGRRVALQDVATLDGAVAERVIVVRLVRTVVMNIHVGLYTSLLTSHSPAWLSDVPSF